MKKLRLQWIKFADEYIELGNAYQAAINAGYSENYAKAQSSKLLENVGIKAYIEERMKKLEEEAIADQKEILKGLTRQARREEKEYQVVVIQKPIYDDNGNFLGMEQTPQTVEIPTQNKDSIKAWELLGKRYQLWTDKVDMTLDLPTIISGADELED
ncbi:terminase small subunit [Anaerococcus sp. NML200537]|uniref:terminase small subunit n=1 Tax=Anaerococcus sp. NML200537 TaxID=2954485 RepID=UPI002237A899|nr:terminase small subunit [Anaerococcus sp. NML200537]MCW6701534.1 terminase small subunit [Anaerococcus sp. NML200537]